MKKYLISVLILIAISTVGCGNLQDLITAINPEATASISQSINDSLGDFETMEQASGDLGDLGSVVSGVNVSFSGAGKSVAFAPSNKSFTCNPPLAVTTTTTCTYTNDEFPPNDEKSSLTLVVSGDLGDINDESDDIYSSWRADITYKDGATSVVTIVEVDLGNSEDSDGNLLTGWVRVTEHRYFSQVDERLDLINTVLLNQGDDPKDDSDNLLKKAQSIVNFKNSSYANYSIEVTPAVKTGDLPKTVWVNNTAKWSDENMKLASYSEAATFITADDSPANWQHAKFSYIWDRKDFEAKDGSKAYEYAELVSRTVKYTKKGFKDVTSTGTIDLETGKFVMEHDFPEQAPVKMIKANGILPKFNNGDGELHRVVYFPNDETRTVDATIHVEEDKRTINFERSDGWKGVFVQERKQLSRVVTGSLANINKQLTIDFKLTAFIDKSATFTYKKDKLTTNQNPDEDGDFSFYPDGSVNGTVNIYNDDGTVDVYKITVDSDKNGKIEKVGGEKKDLSES